jgi:hypothetical protein
MKPAAQLGDIHNFGRTVQIDEEGDGSLVVVKPRSVFWESLLFGTRSPILALLADCAPFSNFRSFAQLEVVSDSPHMGKEKLLVSQPADAVPAVEPLLHDFMDLCAYCLALGVADLNCENLLTTESGLVVVDVESLFLALPSVSATCLMASRNMLHRVCGIAKLLPQKRLLAVDTVASLLARFHASCGAITRQLFNIQHVLDGFHGQLESVPIRIIARPTGEYARAIEDRDRWSGLFPEEVCQLERGDIPYFFCLSGGKTIFYYGSSDFETLAASREFTEFFQQQFVTQFPDARNISDPSWFMNRAVPVSMLELYDFLALFLASPARELRGEGYRMVLEPELVSIETDQYHWGLVRQYEDEFQNRQVDNRALELDGDRSGTPSSIPLMCVSFK